MWFPLSINESNSILTVGILNEKGSLSYNYLLLEICLLIKAY